MSTTEPYLPRASPAIRTQRPNVPALLSLIFGVLGCVPLIMSLLATILGVVGLLKARKPETGGKTLGIIGLVLGIVGLLGWSGLGGALFVSYQTSKPARVVANQFAVDLSTGQIDAAVGATAGMTTVQLTDVADQMAAWGPATSTSFTSFGTRANLDGTTICELGGTATFATGGEKRYTVRLVKRNGTFKVEAFNFQ